MYMKINGSIIPESESKYLLQTATLALARRFPYQSIEIIKENTCTLYNQFLEVLTGSKREKSLLKNKIEKFISILSKIKDKETVINFIYNFLLSLEGLSTLHGFGMTNQFKDKININPEKQSIYK